MESCLGESHLHWCILYLDDIVLFSQAPKEHLHRLKAVFNKLKAAGLKLKPSKCDLFKQQINYLGHVVSKEGVSTDPEKIKAVTEWPQPITLNEVRSFLGFVSYYRRFISNFSKVAKPLNKLLQNLEGTPSKFCNNLLRKSLRSIGGQNSRRPLRHGKIETLCHGAKVVHYLAVMNPPLGPYGKEFLFCHVGLAHPHRQLELPVSLVPLPQAT